MTRPRVSLIILCVFIVIPACAQEALIASQQPVSVGMSLQGEGLTLDVQAATAATVSVFCPISPGLISFTGLTQQIEVAYDQKKQLLSLSLPPGKYKVTIRSLR
jgi:hypothetical protein